MLKASEHITELVDHFFRYESAKMIAVLTKIFGPENLDLVEDVVQDALVEAMNHWQYTGVPVNPSGWLFRVAKNKALNILKKKKYRKLMSLEVSYYLQSELTTKIDRNDFLSQEQISDDQLRMLFTCCHPCISVDSQIALALKTLCGLSIPEIAKAFLATEETINKRLVRARQKIRVNKISFEVPKGDELENRTGAVLSTIYLLFNEGYSASKGSDIVRYELCQEAVRLAQMLVDNENIQHKTNAHALLSLMFLNASRFRARQDHEGNLITLQEQDRSLWDKKLKDTGLYHLNEATKNGEAGVYHSMAAISAHHATALNFDSTNWKGILSIYDHLIWLDGSPIILLNRAIAILKVLGPERALAELEAIENLASLKSYHLLYSTKAAFLIQLSQYSKAAECLKKAIRFSSLQAERDLLEKRLVACNKKIF